MNSGLNGVKTVVWALACAAALIAVLIGLVFAISNKYNGDRTDGALHLSGEVIQKPSGFSDNQPAVPDGYGASDGGTALANTQDMGIEYAFGFTYICDGSIVGINSYSAVYGGNGTAQLWTDAGTGFPAASASDTIIISPSDGSRLSPASAAMVYQPKRIAIYLGGDNLASATEESFIAGYTALIQSLLRASSETKIVCCSIGSIAVSYTGMDGLTAQGISQANQWIKTVAENTGCYFADLASVLNESNGYLKNEYAGADGRTLNNDGIAAIIDYFRYHASV